MMVGNRICLGVGLAVLGVGLIFGLVLFPNILQSKIKQQIRLEKDGDLYNRWVNITIPIYMKVYFFNVTNPTEFSEGAAPILDEIGPYVYEQKREKLVVEPIPVENDTISYRPVITYYFRPDKSNGLTQDDVINFINVPFLSVAATAAKSNFIVRSVILDVLEDFEQKLFTPRSVGELLFEGSYEPMIDELSKAKGEELMPDNRFGIFYKKNGTAQDLLEIFSGVVANDKFGETISWNNQTKLSYWDNEYCDMINGSDGSIFPPSVSKERTLRIFSPDMCRSIYMSFTEEVELKGIPAYKFTTPRAVMEDPRVNPENACYCMEPGEGMEYCTKTGVFRIAPCRKGAPIVVSWPHFYDGDTEYLEQCIGLSPDQGKHETYICLEPNTGALLEASKRFQINVEIQRNKHFGILKKLPTVILPLLWIDESVSLTEENADMIKRKLLTPMKIGGFVTYSFFGIGIAFVGTALVWRKRKNGKS